MSCRGMEDGSEGMAAIHLPVHSGSGGVGCRGQIRGPKRCDKTVATALNRRCQRLSMLQRLRVRGRL